MPMNSGPEVVVVLFTEYRNCMIGYSWCFILNTCRSGLISKSCCCCSVVKDGYTAWRKGGLPVTQRENNTIGTLWITTSICSYFNSRRISFEFNHLSRSESLFLEFVLSTCFGSIDASVMFARPSSPTPLSPINGPGKSSRSNWQIVSFAYSAFPVCAMSCVSSLPWSAKIGFFNGLSFH